MTTHPNPSATPATASCARPPRAGWHACDGLPPSENARGQRPGRGPGRGVESLGPPPTGQFGYVEKFGGVEKWPPRPPAPPGTFSHLSPPRRASWGAPGPACRRLRPGQDLSGSIYIFGGEGGGEDPRHPPPLSQDIYPSPWSAPAISRPCRRPVALSAPPRPLANARDKDRAPGHAAARGAASPSRGSHQLVSLGCVENLGMSKTRPAPTGQFGCVENFEPRPRPRVYRRLASLPGRAVVVRLLPPSPSPSTGERRRPSGLAGRRPPPHRRRGWEDRSRAPRPPARAKGDARTLPPSGLPLGPGHHAWSSHCPLARYAWPAAAVNLPAGRRWPGGFSPHYIPSAPIWVGKCPASLKVYQNFSWGTP